MLPTILYYQANRTGNGVKISLAYDIVTKGHGGELKAETKEKGGSEFIIQLPTKSDIP